VKIPPVHLLLLKKHAFPDREFIQSDPFLFATDSFLIQTKIGEFFCDSLEYSKRRNTDGFYFAALARRNSDWFVFRSLQDAKNCLSGG
jgi:hypothetical protein